MSLVRARRQPNAAHRRRVPTPVLARVMLTIVLPAVIAGAVTGVSPSTALGAARTTSDVDDLWRASPLEQTSTTGAPAGGRSTDLGEAAGAGSSADDDRPSAGSGVPRTAALLVGAVALLLLGMLILASRR